MESASGDGFFSSRYRSIASHTTTYSSLGPKAKAAGALSAAAG